MLIVLMMVICEMALKVPSRIPLPYIFTTGCHFVNVGGLMTSLIFFHNAKKIVELYFMICPLVHS